MSKGSLPTPNNIGKEVNLLCSREIFFSDPGHYFGNFRLSGAG
jgi:hypothetical protein